jgi:hypothetical protein
MVEELTCRKSSRKPQRVAVMALLESAMLADSRDVDGLALLDVPSAALHDGYIDRA